VVTQALQKKDQSGINVPGRNGDKQFITELRWLATVYRLHQPWQHNQAIGFQPAGAANMYSLGLIPSQGIQNYTGFRFVTRRMRILNLLTSLNCNGRLIT
jgi:hypothetical protein